MGIDRARRDELARAQGYDSWASWTEHMAGEAGCAVCGEPTVKRPVRPCSRPEAWGVQGEEEGPCTDHQEDAEAKRQAIKARYLELVASGNYTLQGCARVAGVDRKTLDRWAATDEAFAERRRRAEAARAGRRLENLSDAMYRDALEGRTRGSERIYLLKVYSASLRRRGVEPALDWDQPEKLELSGAIDTGGARKELERKLDAIRERLAVPEGAGEQPAPANGQDSGSAPARGGGSPPSSHSSGRR